uniref:Death domain-containing protein n=1 Tax=Amphimedon queenslandica TaxID=400682 RepID=A0A1X7UBR6_AMPQE
MLSSVESTDEQLNEENGFGVYTKAEKSGAHNESHTVIQLQKMKSVLQNMVSGMDYLELYSEKSDISCTMNRLIYDENPMSPTEESPSKSSDSLDDESQTSDIEEAMEFEKKTMEIPRSLSVTKALKLDFPFLLDLVKTSSVPVVMCVATLTGLSPKRKADLFQDFIKMAVRFRNCESETAKQYYASLQERCSKEGLSSFNFNILGKSPFNDLMWLLGTKRSSISLCFLCCLLQALKLRDIPIESLDIAENEADVNKEDLRQNKHGEWLFYEVTKRLKALKKHQEKLDLLTPGVTFLTVFNIGPSKAAHNFLPFLGQHCKRLLPLFFASTADCTELCKPLKPEAYDEYKSSVNHLLNAYVPRRKFLNHFVRFHSRENSGQPVFMRQPSYSQESKFNSLKEIFEEQGFDANFKDIDLSNMKQTKEILERMVIKNMSKYVTGLPVRWVFLRSFLQALNISLITRSDISKLATSCGAGIDSSEVEAFLTTFTSFASLLYIPSYTDIVLLDIERFTDCLDKVFDCGHSLLDKANLFGFITEGAIDKLAKDEELDPKMFKSLLKSFRFAVPVCTSKVKSNNIFFIEADCSFYIPSMRPTKATNGPQFHSLYLQYTSCVPGNIQVYLVRHFLKYSNCSLVPYLHINASVIRIHHSKEKHIDVTIIDHKDIVELRLEHGRSTEAYKTAFPLVVKACTAAMEDVKKSVDDLEYYFLLRCTESNDHQFIYHRMTNDGETSCESCSKVEASDSYPISLREYWKSSVSKIAIESDGKELEITKDSLELASLAVKLSQEFVDDESQLSLLRRLKVEREVWDGIKVKTGGGWMAFAMLLDQWIKKHKKSKDELLEELHMFL